MNNNSDVLRKYCYALYYGIIETRATIITPIGLNNC